MSVTKGKDLTELQVGSNAVKNVRQVSESILPNKNLAAKRMKLTVRTVRGHEQVCS